MKRVKGVKMFFRLSIIHSMCYIISVDNALKTIQSKGDEIL